MAKRGAPDRPPTLPGVCRLAALACLWALGACASGEPLVDDGADGSPLAGPTPHAPAATGCAGRCDAGLSPTGEPSPADPTDPGPPPPPPPAPVVVPEDSPRGDPPPPEAPPPAQEPPPEPVRCADGEESSRCEGQTLIVCSPGRNRLVECEDNGWLCVEIGGRAACREEAPPPDEPPPAEPPPAQPPPAQPPPAEPPPAQPPPAAGCGGLDWFGVCDGTTLLWCEDGQARSHDCWSDAAVCLWIDDDHGNDCVDFDGFLDWLVEICGSLDFVVALQFADEVCAGAPDPASCVLFCASMAQ